MKLRSRDDGASSSKANMNPEYIEESDGDLDMMDLDVDYNALSSGEESEFDDAIEFIQPMPERKKSRKKKKKEERPVLMWEALEQENQRWVAENSAKDDIELSNHNNIVAETVDPPSDLIMPLLRYQKEWLFWSLKQEESDNRGGILADEMGMGKTVQAISLVLAKREINELPSSSSVIKATLVICPVVAVMQWVSEIERFTSKGSTKVLVYHGPNREKNIHNHQFAEYDFVITTFSIVEADYRSHLMPMKTKCKYCGKLFHHRKINVHLKYYCGPSAERTAKQSKQKQKEKEKDNHKQKKTTEKRNPKKTSIMHSVKWNRIVLDEAHYIKERSSNTTRAILALQSSYKWALSGTPLQNRVGELYSLVRFLQIVPYSYYFCKDCDCRSLDYHSTSAKCPHCLHSTIRHFCWWNRYVSTPIKRYGNARQGRDTMILLKYKILTSIMLRRTKRGRVSDLALAPRIVNLRRDTLDIREEDYYRAIYNRTKAQFNTFVEEGTVMNNYAHIFDLLTRLRQAVDHPYLVEYSLSAMQRNGKAVDDMSKSQQCGWCHELVEDPVVTSCAHVFCKSCLIDYSASEGQASCPLCSKLIIVDFTSNKGSIKDDARTTIGGLKPSSILNRIQLNEFQTSTKIEALREEIRKMVERDRSAKGIVFSQFTSFLDLIHYSLEKSGVSCVKLDGSMSLGARDASIKRFTEDPHCRIFLMSLKAGGVALNLTVASYVFLMDPCWNPAVERQAQDRIHRIGQHKTIRIVRFIIENTVEEKILKLQEKKELVFEGTVGGSSEAIAKLTEADMRFLFAT